MVYFLLTAGAAGGLMAVAGEWKAGNPVGVILGAAVAAACGLLLWGGAA